MHVHFVCSGNIFRSRMAEAYLNSLKKDGVQADSSGIMAQRNSDGPITWYAELIIKKYGLVSYMSHTWKQTTADLIKKADLIIFMRQEHLDYVQDELGLTPDNYQVWGVGDIENFDFANEDPQKQYLNIINIAEQIFAKIKMKSDQLVKNL